MRITIGSDHAAFELKEALIHYLRQDDHLNNAGIKSEMFSLKQRCTAKEKEP